MNGWCLKIYFGNFRKLDIAGAPCFLTRTGYTGEDGWEIVVESGIEDDGERVVNFDVVDIGETVEASSNI